ncbi:hypothetical protein BJF90_05290 [Pseudonocardia sp. CNS-004]|nr:hypothetical protein BJF90_05290 [Pseudonocardia sp. CNS-004]
MRTALRGPSAPTTYRAHTVPAGPSVPRTPSGVLRRAVNAVPNRTSPPSRRTSAARTGSMWSCAQIAG